MTKRIAAGIAGLVVVAALGTGCATGRGGMTPYRPAAVPSIWPVNDEASAVSSPFGLRGQGPAMRHHNGVDITAAKGAPVVATGDGLVSFSGRAGSYGRAVKISHTNGIETCYAHLRKCKAKKGRTVAQGERIGSVGKSGRADGYHLHYEVRVYGAPVDPAPFLPKREKAAPEEAPAGA